MSSQASHTCKNCQHEFVGKYCNNCGEKYYDEGHKKVSHLFEEVIHFFTHFEGSFFTTLRTFVTSPGKLSLDYCNGIRKKYFKPIPFFLLFVVMYLLFPKFEGLNMRFSTYVNRDYNTSWYARPAARQKIAALKIDANELARRYDKKSAFFAKPLLFLLIPLTALFLSLVFYNKKKYFFDHFVLATEVNTFFIGINFLLLPLLMLASTTIYKPSAQFFYDGGPAMIISFLVFLSIAILMFKRFYLQSWIITLLKAAVFGILMSEAIHYIYKMVLYYTVMLFL